MVGDDNIVLLTNENFEDEVLNSELPVLVDFWADWCVPCLRVAPIIEELATKFTEKIKVGKMNVDENLETVTKFSILSIPTVILFKNGEPITQLVGALNPPQYEAAIVEVIA
jgi:thioredoxin 1